MAKNKDKPRKEGSSRGKSFNQKETSRKGSSGQSLKVKRVPLPPLNGKGDQNTFSRSNRPDFNKRGQGGVSRLL